MSGGDALDEARWKRLEALFHAALERPEDERRAFVEAASSGDSALAGRVLAMLDADAREPDLARLAHAVLDESIPAALLRQSFGPYRIRRLLGEGGMGVVYLAERSDLGSVAALKILRDASLSPSRRERFAAEQRTLAQLRHPAIAQLFDADTLEDGTPWFAMEYVEGRPLTDYVREHETSLRGRLLLFRAVCAAVGHAHRQAVVHRDLKPSNILVTGEGTVKLLDFGIAKHIDALGDAAVNTRTGLHLMTPAYAAPEQFLAGRVGTYTDVYALGVIFYELLTGRLPFDLASRAPSEVARIIAEQEAERPSTVARARVERLGDAVRIPSASRAAWADLDVLCLTAMHKDPQRRYQTVEALTRDIDHFLDGEPLDARPEGLGYRLGKLLRRHRQVVAAAAAAFALVTTLVAVYTVRLTVARDAALAESTRTQRIQRFMLSLFQGGEEEMGPARDLRVLTVVDRGLEDARALDREPLVQAELYQTLGGIYQGLGKLDLADELLGLALDRRRAVLGTDHADVARSLVAIGLLRSEQASYEEAESLAREGLAMARRHCPPDHPDVAFAISALGQVLDKRGKHEEAIDLHQQAVSLLEGPGPASPELSTALHGLANAHFYAGHYEASEALNRRVLWISRLLYGEGHPEVADDLVNLGALQHEQGRYAQAESFYRQALRITENWFGPEHPRTASVLAMLARSVLFQDRIDEAIGLLRRALSIQERVYGPNHPRVASALNELGSAALQQARYDAAEAYFRRTLAAYRAVHGERHHLVATALSNLGSVYTGRGEPVRAEPLFREAVVLYHDLLGPGHASTGIARIKLGRALLRQKRYAEAERESRAGFDVLSRQAEPSVSYLRAARADLAAAYAALGRPDEATSFAAQP